MTGEIIALYNLHDVMKKRPVQLLMSEKIISRKEKVVTYIVPYCEVIFRLIRSKKLAEIFGDERPAGFFAEKVGIL